MIVKYFLWSYPISQSNCIWVYFLLHIIQFPRKSATFNFTVIILSTQPYKPTNKNKNTPAHAYGLWQQFVHISFDQDEKTKQLNFSLYFPFFCCIFNLFCHTYSICHTIFDVYTYSGVMLVKWHVNDKMFAQQAYYIYLLFLLLLLLEYDAFTCQMSFGWTKNVKL